MASRRALTFGGTAAAAGVAYYLYKAGGDPKVAEKQFEQDASRLSSKVRGELPGKEKEAKTQVKLSAEEAGQKVDSAVDQLKAKTREADKTLEGYRANAEKNLTEYKQEAGKNINQAIDKFDKKVEDGAAKSKSWVSGWFGGSK